MSTSFIKYLVIICLFFISCSSIFENENNRVRAKLDNEEVTIENGKDESIYYFVVDKNILALITWAPYSSEDNKIMPGALIKVPVSNIMGYEEGHDIVVFYWFETEAPFNVKNVEVL